MILDLQRLLDLSLQTIQILGDLLDLFNLGILILLFMSLLPYGTNLSMDPLFKCMHFLLHYVGHLLRIFNCSFHDSTVCLDLIVNLCFNNLDLFGLVV